MFASLKEHLTRRSYVDLEALDVFKALKPADSSDPSSEDERIDKPVHSMDRFFDSEAFLLANEENPEENSLPVNLENSYSEEEGYFLAHEKDLLQRDGEVYVAIRGNEVVRSNADLDSLTSELYNEPGTSSHTLVAKLGSQKPAEFGWSE